MAQQRPELFLQYRRDLVPHLPRRGDAVLVYGGEVRETTVGTGAVTALQRAEPGDEGIHRRIPRPHRRKIDIPLQRRAVPPLGVHDVLGPHLREHGRTAAALVHVLPHQLEVSQRVPVSPLLEIAVPEPLGVVVGSPGGAVLSGRDLVL